jgi:hypothetical protein
MRNAFANRMNDWRNFGGVSGIPVAPHPATTSPAPAATPVATPPPTAATGTNALSPTSALNNFANSAGMQFQNEQAANALNNLYAGRGMLQSGAAMKGITDYIANMDLQRYFMPYTQLLAGQQQMGGAAASSLAGQGQNYAATMANLGSAYGGAVNGAGSNYSGSVGSLGSGLAGAVGQLGQNYGNAVTGINAGMGQAIGNGADALSNAALLRGQANSGMWNSIGGALGSFASSAFPTTPTY